jgi:acyl dehydratase
MRSLVPDSRVFPSVSAVGDSVGAIVGTSRWITMSQERINGFATVTEDEQWIHVDTARAAQSSYGSTIAHGFLTLAMAAPILADVLHIDGLGSAVNYGLNRVRFPAPVRAGERVRGTLRILAAEPIASGMQIVVELTVESAGSERPVCVAELVIRLYEASA